MSEDVARFGVVDDARIRFLYGDDILGELDEWDLTRESDRMALLERSTGHLAPLRQALVAIVANPILDDDPPEVWSTVERLLGDCLVTRRALGPG